MLKDWREERTIMMKLYKKSEITFAIMLILAYMVFSSLADQLSEFVGVFKSVTAAVHIAMALVLFFWIRNNDLSIKYGFCRVKIPAKRFLYYLPLIIIASASLWRGIGPQYNFPEILFFIISMCCVGFLEEVFFRGLLFRAMEKDNLKKAVIVSALTFGLGHIVNFFNGSGQDLASTIVQIIFAILIGFVLVLIFIHGKSLLPCILFHSANNALSSFAAEETIRPQAEKPVDFLLVIMVLGSYLFYLARIFPRKADLF